MLEALGVNTSKTFSLIETGVELARGDEPSPTRSSVLVRLSHSHIRIGTFQGIAFERDKDLLMKLVEFCLAYLDGDAAANLSTPISYVLRVGEHSASISAPHYELGC